MTRPTASDLVAIRERLAKATPVVYREWNNTHGLWWLLRGLRAFGILMCHPSRTDVMAFDFEGRRLTLESPSCYAHDNALADIAALLSELDARGAEIKALREERDAALREDAVHKDAAVKASISEALAYESLAQATARIAELEKWEVTPAMIEAAARARCPYKERPCPGSACRYCVELALPIVEAALAARGKPHD